MLGIGDFVATKFTQVLGNDRERLDKLTFFPVEMEPIKDVMNVISNNSTIVSLSINIDDTNHQEDVAQGKGFPLTNNSVSSNINQCLIIKQIFIFHF